MKGMHTKSWPKQPGITNLELVSLQPLKILSKILSKSFSTISCCCMCSSINFAQCKCMVEKEPTLSSKSVLWTEVSTAHLPRKMGAKIGKQARPNGTYRTNAWLRKWPASAQPLKRPQPLPARISTTCRLAVFPIYVMRQLLFWWRWTPFTADLHHWTPSLLVKQWMPLSWFLLQLGMAYPWSRLPLHLAHQLAHQLAFLLAHCPKRSAK